MKTKKIIADLFTPDKSVNKNTQNIVLVIWVSLLMIFWSFTKCSYIPHPMDIIGAVVDLISEDDLIRQLMISIGLCVKSMFYATLISLFAAYLSRMSGFRAPLSLISTARFLTMIGLPVLFAQIMPDTQSQKTALLVFGITVFLFTSFLGVMVTVTKDDLDYARTLRMGEWRTMYEVIILGKASDMFECIKSNFAMAWIMLPFVENICRSDGGIGIILTDQNKHFHLDAVYGILIIGLCIGILMDKILGFMKRIFFPYSFLKLNDK
jgi:NitT/TauT family transport system permease protein